MSTGPTLVSPEPGAASGHYLRSPVEEEVIALFDDLRGSLLRYLLSFSLSVRDAEDLLQESFLALFHHLLGGKPKHNLRGWLFRVAHNLARKHQRDQKVARIVPGGIENRSVVCPVPNPEDRYAAIEIGDRVLAVVAALPEPTRCCFHLRAEGLRYREIAAVLEISLGSVAARLEEALGRIACVVGR